MLRWLVYDNGLHLFQNQAGQASTRSKCNLSHRLLGSSTGGRQSKDLLGLIKKVNRYQIQVEGVSQELKDIPQRGPRLFRAADKLSDLFENVQFLSHYRHPRCLFRFAAFASVLLCACKQ